MENGSLETTLKQEKYQYIPIEKLNRIARCINFRTNNSNYVVLKEHIRTINVLVDDVLNNLSVQGNTFDSAARKFFISTNKIKAIYENFGITKNNNGK